MDTDAAPTPQPSHASPVSPASTAPTARPRRRLVLPVAGAALTLVVAGGGLGYAAERVSEPTTRTVAPSASGSTSTRWQQPPSSPYGSSGTYGLPGTPGTPGGSAGPGASGATGSTASSDTTARATGSELTGLVRIVSTMKYAGETAAGTGMVLTSGGEVVTNHHVVEGATRIRVTDLTSGTTYTARVVGTDAGADVAVLQLVGASGLDTVRTDTDDVSTGAAVTAVGDGGGASYLSAARGTVLAVDRSITTQSEGTASGERLTGLIEISSDVVPGYSGGATYDAAGAVVGMTTAASSGGDIDGYAVPIATVLRIADDLEHGATDTAYVYGRPAFLGVGLADSSTRVGQVYDATPAARAGIAAGDTITRIDGARVASAAALRRVVSTHVPGDSVSVTWTDTSGAAHTSQVTLAKGPVG